MGVLLQILPDVDGQLFFQIDEPLGNVLGYFICRFVLIQISVQRFDTHVASVGHQISDSGITVLHAQLHIGLHPGHAFGDWVGIFALIMVLLQKLIDFLSEFLVFFFADGQLLLKMLILSYKLLEIDYCSIRICWCQNSR